MVDDSSRPWKAIAAMARNRVIGYRGSIPWHLPEDFKWVKARTLGQTIAMGRKTFESMGRPLPGRENLVITRSTREIPGCVVLPSLSALEAYPAAGTVWIFGGAEIYRQALPRVHELYLTVVDAEPEGDTFFPPFEDQFTLAEVVRRTPEFEIRRYLPA
jgi:dihydrofolate reductase